MVPGGRRVGVLPRRVLQVPRVSAPGRALSRGHGPVLVVPGVANWQGGRPQELLLAVVVPKLPVCPALPGGREVRERHLVLVRHGRRLCGVEPGVSAGQLRGGVHRVAAPLPGCWVLLVLGSFGGKFKLGTRGTIRRRHEGSLDVADDALVGAGLVQGSVVGVGSLAPVLDDAHHDGHDEDEHDAAEADDRDEDVERLALVIVALADVSVHVVGGGDIVGPDAVLDDPEVHALVGEGAEAAVGDEADVHAGVGLLHVLEDEAVEVLVVAVAFVNVVAMEVAVDVDVVDVGGRGVEDAVALASDGEGVGRGGGAGGEALQPLDVRLGDGFYSGKEN